MDTTIQSLKLELIDWIANVNDVHLIKELANLKAENQRISIEQYNKELEEANAEIERGEFVTHQQAVKEIHKWREK
jgi:predicted transcriptional regulator